MIAVKRTGAHRRGPKGATSVFGRHALAVAILLAEASGVAVPAMAQPGAGGGEPAPGMGPAASQRAVAGGDRGQAFEYEATGKRDPFRPLALMRPASEIQTPLTPLQGYDLGQLRLVGVIQDVVPPRAMVEDSSGLGFILTPGTPIGTNGGVVTAIRPRQVVVEEWYTDVVGERHRRETVLELPEDRSEVRK